ncbi:MAG: efflux RND transporter periplasmic adaptor subunit [Calditrichaeota bacterium]|nr:efflux RND transporter periplasmic adaptor subunit [Calditrichota bacterium]RQW03266.1 MAG: efflux RND transporter periplasmic adaptor subunit [Calditrichota bacterium]
MSRKKVILISIALVFVAVIMVAIFSRGNGPEAVEVQTAEVDRQKIVETVSATGRIQPKTQVKISADVAAKIIQMPVEEGDWVEKGQLLVQLDREKFEAVVERSEANVRSAEADAKLAKENMLKAEKDYERTRELFERNLESQATLDQMYAAYQVSKARYQSALEVVEQGRAMLKQARDDLSKTSIFAPMSGTISALNKEVGEIALGSQFQEDVIMIISDLGGMEALVDVDENDIVSVALGDSALIEVDALPDRVFNGVVTEIASSAKITGSGSVDQKTDFEVEITLLNPDDELRPGMTTSSDIITEIRQNALAVPIQSVAYRTPEQLKRVQTDRKGDVAIADDSATQNYKPDREGFVEVVFVVVDGSVVAKQVKTGIQSDTHIEIIEGITEGSEIVTGNYRAISQLLTNGSPIVIKNVSTGR